jgi:hypothetical protein
VATAIGGLVGGALLGGGYMASKKLDRDEDLADDGEE